MVNSTKTLKPSERIFKMDDIIEYIFTAIFYIFAAIFIIVIFTGLFLWIRDKFWELFQKDEVLIGLIISSIGCVLVIAAGVVLGMLIFRGCF